MTLVCILDGLMSHPLSPAPIYLLHAQAIKGNLVGRGFTFHIISSQACMFSPGSTIMDAPARKGSFTP